MSEKKGSHEKEDLVIESVGDAEEFEMKEQPQPDQQLLGSNDRNPGVTKVIWIDLVDSVVKIILFSVISERWGIIKVQ